MSREKQRIKPYKITVFWHVILHSPVQAYLFRRKALPPYVKYITTRLHGVTSQKTTIFLVPTVGNTKIARKNTFVKVYALCLLM